MTDLLFYIQVGTLTVTTLTLIVLALTLWASRQMLEANTRPQIECHLRSRPEKPNVFELAVTNFGRGAAKNLEIELIGVDEDDFSSHSVVLAWRRKGPFTLLGPGESVASMFGFGPGLVGEKQEPLKPFKVRASYQWTAFWNWRSDDVVEYHDMDVRPFQGIVPRWPKDELVELLKKELPAITKAIASRPRPLLQTNTGDIDDSGLRRLELSMPELFAEMREDLKKTPLCREFITMSKHAMYSGGDDRQVLVYYYESHEILTNKMDILVNSGAVIDITYTNVNRYVMSETLVGYLAKSNAP